MDDRDGHARNDAMVSTLVRRGLVPAGAVEAAFRAVARHRFLPGIDLDIVYEAEKAIPTKREPTGEVTSSSSAPAIMGLMLADLAVEPSHRVLEIGAGTGYNAALLATLVGPAGETTSIDLAPDVAAGAAANLAASGFDAVDVRVGDGWLGAPDRGPFDRIIVTVGVSDLSPAWVAQLAPGGRLVVPLAFAVGVEAAIAFVREGAGLRSVHLNRCGFMRLRGPYADEPHSERHPAAPCSEPSKGPYPGDRYPGDPYAGDRSRRRRPRRGVGTAMARGPQSDAYRPISLRQFEVEALPTAAFDGVAVDDFDWAVSRRSFTFLARRR